MVADRFASSVYKLWFEEAMRDGQLETMKYSRAPNFYDGLNKEAYCACSWIGASRGQIDELKETQAAVLRIKNGLSTHEDELAKLGKDYRKVFAQLERERDDMEARGIMMEETNQMNAASGTPSEANDGGSGGSDD
jgi:capsid protein